MNSTACSDSDSVLLHSEPKAVSVRPLPSQSDFRHCITQPCSAAELEFHLEGAASTEDGTLVELTDTARKYLVEHSQHVSRGVKFPSDNLQDISLIMCQAQQQRHSFKILLE